jgi:hypothetical protein
VLDRVQAGQASITLDNRARLFDPTYLPVPITRTNLVTNPSFETNTNSWASAQATIARSTTFAYVGAASLATTMSSTTDNNFAYTTTTTTATGTHTFSAYFYVPAGSSLAGRMVSLSVEGGTATTTGVSSSSATLVAGSWVRARLARNVTVAGSMVWVARISGTLATAVGLLIYTDAALVETLATFGAYFDGSVYLGTDDLVSLTWNGTANASTSTVVTYTPNSYSQYASSIVPRKNVSITLDSEPIFTGLVDDWNIGYELSGDSTSVAECVDGFIQLGQVTMGTAVRTSQASGARVGAVLTEASWPTGKRDIDTGQVTLQADTPAANTNVLDYLQTVTDTEFGLFFMDRSGNANFADRLANQNFSNPVLLGGTGIPFTAVGLDYGAEQLYNEVTLVRQGGGTAVRTDATSQTTYGISELSKTGLLFNTDADNGTLADYLLARYKDPALRINEVSIAVDGLTSAQRTTLARMDLGQPLQVTFTPKVGAAITQYATLDRISHSVSPASHTMTLTMSRAEASFILNSSLFGQLNDDQLGF